MSRRMLDAIIDTVVLDLGMGLALFLDTNFPLQRFWIFILLAVVDIFSIYNKEEMKECHINLKTEH